MVSIRHDEAVRVPSLSDVEGGGRVTGALLAEGLIDRIVWFRAASVIGGDGTPVAAAFGVDELAAAPRFTRVAVESCGDDVVETYRASGAP